MREELVQKIADLIVCLASDESITKETHHKFQEFISEELTNKELYKLASLLIAEMGKVAEKMMDESDE